MSLRRLLIVFLAAVSSLLLSACDLVNASTRPAGQFDRVTDALSAYEKGTGYTYDYEFIRNFGSLPKRSCEISEFTDWERTESEDGESTAFSRKLEIFGCETEVSVGIRNENQKIIAVYMVFHDNGETGPLQTTEGLWNALSDKAGTTYEAYLDGEKVKAKDIAALLGQKEEAHSYRGIWPRNSIKWSVMLDYSFTDGKEQLTVCFL